MDYQDQLRATMEQVLAYQQTKILLMANNPHYTNMANRAKQLILLRGVVVGLYLAEQISRDGDVNIETFLNQNTRD